MPKSTVSSQRMKDSELDWLPWLVAALVAAHLLAFVSSYILDLSLGSGETSCKEENTLRFWKLVCAKSGITAFKNVQILYLWNSLSSSINMADQTAIALGYTFQQDFGILLF